MKVTYLERIENRTAFSRHMYCRCGSHDYDIVEQLEPETETPWFLRCCECGFESYASPARDIAIARWKQQQNGAYNE